MLRPRLRIRSKIFVPVTLLLVGTVFLTAAFSATLVSRSLEQRFRRQLENAAHMASQPDFALNSAILERMKQVVGADVITFEPGEGMLAGTVTESAQRGLIEEVRAQYVGDHSSAASGQVVFRDFEHNERPYTAAYRRLRGASNTVVAFVADTSDVRETKLAVLGTTLLLTLILAISMSLLSLGIARTITRPVEQLVQHTHRLAEGDLESKADIRSLDEIGLLARSVDDMATQLRRSKERALHSEKLVIAGQLAARVAHDVRTPLSSIKMYAQILRSRPGIDQKASESLTTILEEVDRANRAVQGLLHLARPAELKLRPGSVNDAVGEVLRLSEAQIRHRGIILHCSLGEGLPCVLLDAERLEQALLNLIQNSTEAFLESGTIWVETFTNEDRSLVFCRICDNGPGIDAEIGGRVFDPFFTTKREGVGLGLVNTKSIVEGHEGTIELSAREGGGTCATIVLAAIEKSKDAADLTDVQPPTSEPGDG